jgi:hypothetical protein
MTSLPERLITARDRIGSALSGRRRRSLRPAPRPRFRPSVEALEEMVLPSQMTEVAVFRPNQVLSFNQYAGAFEADNLQRLSGTELAFASDGSYAVSIPDNVFSPLSGYFNTDGTSVTFSYQNSFASLVGVTAFALDGRIEAASDGTLLLGLNYRAGNDLAAVVNGTGYGSSVSNGFEAVVTLQQVSGPPLGLTPATSTQPNPTPPGPTPPVPTPTPTPTPGPTPPTGSSQPGPTQGSTPPLVPSGDVTGLVDSSVVPPTGPRARIQRQRYARLRVTNHSNASLPAVRLVVSGLHKGIKLRRASGTTTSGAPYVILLGLQPGETREVVLGFQNNTNAPVRFQTQFVA